MRTRKGFTLVELLVVIGIIALLAAILFPVFQKAMKYAHKASCTNKMHQICVAAKMYASDCDGKGPSFGDGRGPLDSLLQYTGHQIIVPATGDYDTFFYCTGAPSSHYYGSPRYSIISDLCGRASW